MSPPLSIILRCENIYQRISFADDPEDRKDGILEVGGEEVSADEADPDYTEYMTGEQQILDFWKNFGFLEKFRIF